MKARLISCGIKQVVEANYILTIVAVMDISDVKIIMTRAATWKVGAKHGDIYMKDDKKVSYDILL